MLMPRFAVYSLTHCPSFISASRKSDFQSKKMFYLLISVKDKALSSFKWLQKMPPLLVLLHSI